MYAFQSNSVFRNRNSVRQSDFPENEQQIGSNLWIAHPKANNEKTTKVNIELRSQENNKKKNTHLRSRDIDLKRTQKRKYNWQIAKTDEPLKYQYRPRKERNQQSMRHLKQIRKKEEMLRMKFHSFDLPLKRKKDQNRRTMIPFPEVGFNRKRKVSWPNNDMPWNQIKDSNRRASVPFPEVMFNKNDLIHWPSEDIFRNQSWNEKMKEIQNKHLRYRAVEDLIEDKDIKDKLPNLNIPIYDRLIHRSYPRSAKFLWILVFAACLGSCFYNTGKSFQEFFYGAPQVTVEFEKINIMPLPSISICPGDLFGLNPFTDLLKSKYCNLPNNKDSRCQNSFSAVNVTDILHPPEITVQDVWQSFNITQMEIPLRRTCSTSKSDQDCLGPVKMGPKNAAGGACLVLATEGVFKTWGIITQITGYADFSKLDVKLTIFNFFLKVIQHNQVEDITFFDLDFGLILPIFLFGMLRALPTQLILQDTYMNPCRDAVTVEKCKTDCLQRILYSEIKCKLPFMINDSLYLCNNSKDFAEAIDVMKKVLSKKEDCILECPRACVTYQFSYLVDVMLIHDQPSLNFSVGFNDNNIRTIKEYYWYSFSLLISDIGGNLGFFLDVNLLSFVEVFEIIIFLTQSIFKRKKNQRKKSRRQRRLLNQSHQHYQLNQKEEPYEVSYGIVGFDRIFANNVSMLRKIMWIILILLSAIACGFLIKHSIYDFLYGDPDIAVLFELNSTIKVPTITICPYKAFERYERIVARKEMYAEEFNITDEISDIPTSELFNIENLTATELWDDAAIDMKWLEKIDIHCKELIGASTFDTVTPPTPRFQYTILGTCISLTLDEMIKYHGHSTSICLTIQTFDFKDYPFSIIMFIHNDEDDPRTLDLEKGLILEDQLLHLVSIEFVKLEFIPREANPCSDSASVAKCKMKCFNDLFEQKLPCKLPFMSNSSSLRYCSKPGEFNESMTIAADIYNKRILNDVCNCPRKCKEYMISLLQDRNAMLKPLNIPINIIYMYFVNNLFTLIKEHSRLNVNTLFSSICGSLGLFLGFCALSILEIIESIIINLFRKFNGKQK